MRNFFVFISIITLSCFCLSCSKENVVLPQESEAYTVHLGWDGELDVTYEPLTRGESNGDIYGIQVYYAQYNNNESTWTPYAYGIFDNTDCISINLLAGYKYRFVATMIRNGKNELYYFADRYYRPFLIHNSESGYAVEQNVFTYSTTGNFRNLDMGKSTLSDGMDYSMPNLERFYGELDDFVPVKDNCKAKIKMKRVSFGAKFIVHGKIAANGTIEAQIEGSPVLHTLISKSNNQMSDIFTFTNVRDAWMDNAYKETVNVNLNWHRSDGSVIPMGRHEVTFKRNATTVIKVNIDNDALDSGLGIEIDETEEMVEDGEIIIQDGEVVETEVDLNQ